MAGVGPLISRPWSVGHRTRESEQEPNDANRSVYRCECGQGFKTWPALSAHTREHTTETAHAAAAPFDGAGFDTLPPLFDATEPSSGMESLPVLGQVAIGAPLNAISDVLDQQSKPSSPIEEVPALEPIPTLVQVPMLEPVSSETESKDYTDMPALRALPAPPAPSDESSANPVGWIPPEAQASTSELAPLSGDENLNLTPSLGPSDAVAEWLLWGDSSGLAGAAQPVLSTPPSPPLTCAPKELPKSPPATTPKGGGSKKRKDTDPVGARQHPCPFPGCSMVLSRPSHLNKHMRVHTNERPHPCTICDMKFKTKWTLTKHIRTHTGEKPFTCEHPGCSKSFTQRGTFLRHKRLHTTEPTAFVCFCGKGFKQQSNFVAHQAIHTEHQFKCTLCEREYRTLRSLQKHVLTHVPTETAEVKKLYCRWCARRFFAVNDSDIREFEEHEASHTETHTVPTPQQV
eukprot:m.462387 g.462387  ORF g.462387 m.462387 type:complete len:459 (+) comp22636_c0_seq1:458-1834(+)